MKAHAVRRRDTPPGAGGKPQCGSALGRVDELRGSGSSSGYGRVAREPPSGTQPGRSRCPIASPPERGTSTVTVALSAALELGHTALLREVGPHGPECRVLQPCRTVSAGSPSATRATGCAAGYVPVTTHDLSPAGRDTMVRALEDEVTQSA